MYNSPEKRREWGIRYRKTENYKRSAFKAQIKNRYGLLWEDYQVLVEKQAGKCALCGLEKKMEIDHDHVTKRVRGLLCHKCNWWLKFVDTVGITSIKEYVDGP